MLAATHILGGAAVYKLTGSKGWIGLPLAFASHLVLDRIPHYDLNITWNLFLGLPIILFVLFLAWKQNDALLPVAGFLGALPDILMILQVGGFFHRIHMSFHFEVYYPLPVYLFFIEGGIAVSLLYYISRERGK
ncbi:hypothetical protein [Pseudalkalibacillus caeni]|uniref:Uncharacterized protein n=1 Tax=Exobacillus caeni TaxID=2574798 RepID=A0A5R9F6K3_9BACL|nr:hypothetical protein [Pseudalkalibacillus caeni]TLS38661.1 hypothetical protein FCL54_03940 [Pseudalkalibacillus caeni]